MSTITEKIKALSEKIFEKVCEYRTHIHQNPELSFEEFETSSFIEKQLEQIGVSKIYRLSETGVIAEISGKNCSENSKHIALRADIDALPIQEETNKPYSSKNIGKMHACGHDVHTSILLGVAEILVELKDELTQPVKLIFQAGEEKNPGGASILIEKGVLENVQEIYGLHVAPDLNVGTLGFKEGLYMASCDEIYITIHGKGGHGAAPHLCVDPIFIGASLVTQLQQIVSRKCDPKIPSVLTFGHFEGIGSTNVIPSKVILKGTFRTMNEDWRKEAHQLIQNQARHLVESLDGKIELEISIGYPFLENNPKLTQQIKNKAENYFGAENCIDLPIRLSSEDFSFYSQKIPATFFRLGVRNEDSGIVHGVHHPLFDIDEKALQIGLQAMSLTVFNL